MDNLDSIIETKQGINKTLRLPTNIEGIDAEWLTAALSSVYPGVAVDAVERLHVIHGSATKIRIRLHYREGTQGNLPATMWVKIGLEPYSDELNEMGIYSVEAMCYNTVLPQFDFAAPKSYFQAEQDDPPQVVILLEDLIARQAAFGLATRPMTVSQAASGLDTLASIHAGTWNDQRLKQLGLYPLFSHGGVIGPIREFIANAELLFNAPRGRAVPAVLRDKTRLTAAYDRYVKLAVDEPVCLQHGDSHVGNTFIEPGGTVGFLDWQCAAIGNWAHDVTYFLVAAIDVKDRRATERELITGYLSALEQHGVQAPSFAQAWESYRRSLIYGFTIWLGNPETMQPPEICLACFERFGTAMMDHDGYGALGV